jgi:GWxTD domain-containing protein
MYRSLLLLSVFILGSLMASAAEKLKAEFTYAIFQSPQQGTYVETWISFDASSVEFVRTAAGKYKGEVEVILIFKLDGKVASFRKYNLSSQEIDDPLARDFDFLDQQRFLLGAGDYLLEISLRDINQDHPAVESATKVMVEASTGKVSISTLQLIERTEPATSPSNLTKAGYNLYPDFYGYYPEFMNRISFYAEIYHTLDAWGADGMFLSTARIESYETGKLMSNISFYRRESAAEVVPLLHSFDITKLPSGNFNLVVEIRDKENQSVAISKTFFQRSNPKVPLDLSDIAAIDVVHTFSAVYTNPDTLAIHIRSCYPLASEMEKMFAANLLKEKDLRYMQQYLYHFWSLRSPTNPELAWLNYKAQVDRVNLTYGTFIKAGFETDRGRTWLKYGEPNTIYRSTHEPEAYPYEIWHYYRLPDNQTNRKFVFVSTEMGANDFNLTHSNAIGEINNQQWHLHLHSRQVGGTNVDRTEYDTNYGSRALEIFNNPY